MKITYPFLILCGVLWGAQPLWGESALQRLLTLVDENPQLLDGNVYFNFALHSQTMDGPSNVVDSSVAIIHSVTSEDGKPSEDLKVNITTSSIGATNTGLIQADVGKRFSVANPEGTWIVAANSAKTQSPILAPVGVVTNTPISQSSVISTKAMGSVNSGSIIISISNGPNN